MKKALFILFAVTLVNACISMDLTPKSQGNSASWYTTETELNMAVNEFYILGYWDYTIGMEQWTDNFTYRNTNRNEILEGTVNGQTWDAYHIWEQAYKLISRANSLLENIHRAEEAGLSAEKVNHYKAEARFARACKYGDLAFFFGEFLGFLEKRDFGSNFTDTNARTNKSRRIKCGRPQLCGRAVRAFDPFEGQAFAFEHGE